MAPDLTLLYSYFDMMQVETRRSSMLLRTRTGSSATTATTQAAVGMRQPGSTTTRDELPSGAFTSAVAAGASSSSSSSSSSFTAAMSAAAPPSPTPGPPGSPRRTWTSGRNSFQYASSGHHTGSYDRLSISMGMGTGMIHQDISVEQKDAVMVAVIDTIEVISAHSAWTKLEEQGTRVLHVLACIDA